MVIGVGYFLGDLVGTSLIPILFIFRISFIHESTAQLTYHFSDCHVFSHKGAKARARARLAPPYPSFHHRGIATVSFVLQLPRGWHIRLMPNSPHIVVIARWCRATLSY